MSFFDDATDEAAARNPSAAWLVSRLRRLRPGERMELRGLGRSLWPLLRSGDRILVEAAGRASLVIGELVIAWMPRSGRLVCHVLIDTEPPRTAPLFGEDDGEVEVLARVVRIRGRPAALDRITRAPVTVMALRASGRAARRRGWTRPIRESLEAVLGSSVSADARRRLVGPARILRVTPEDLESLVIFIGHHLPWLSPEWMETQLSGAWRRGAGGAFAAFDRQNRIRAFGYLGRYSDEGLDVSGIWLRALYTDPIARRLGLSHRLIDARLSLAVEQGFREVLSDIYRDNRRSLALHLKHGFVELHGEELAPFEPLLRRAERGGRALAILRWRAPEPTASPSQPEPGRSAT